MYCILACFPRSVLALEIEVHPRCAESQNGEGSADSTGLSYHPPSGPELLFKPASVPPHPLPCNKRQHGYGRAGSQLEQRRVLTVCPGRGAWARSPQLRGCAAGTWSTRGASSCELCPETRCCGLFVLADLYPCVQMFTNPPYCLRMCWLSSVRPSLPN